MLPYKLLGGPLCCCKGLCLLDFILDLAVRFSSPVEEITFALTLALGDPFDIFLALTLSPFRRLYSLLVNLEYIDN